MKKENNTTIIAIAHRLTTLKNCDRIIVLNKGKIEEDGKFDELIEKNGMFSDMYYGKLKNKLIRDGFIYRCPFCLDVSHEYAKPTKKK